MSELRGLALDIGQNSLDSRSLYRVYVPAPSAKRHGGFWGLEEASDWLQWVNVRVCQQWPVD
jgi:hypothetical protein